MRNPELEVEPNINTKEETNITRLERVAPDRFRIHFDDHNTSEELSEPGVEKIIGNTPKFKNQNASQIFRKLDQEDRKDKIRGIKIIQLSDDKYLFIDKRKKRTSILSSEKMQSTIASIFYIDDTASKRILNSGKIKRLEAPLFNCDLKQISKEELKKHNTLNDNEIEELIKTIEAHEKLNDVLHIKLDNDNYLLLQPRSDGRYASGIFDKATTLENLSKYIKIDSHKAEQLLEDTEITSKEHNQLLGARIEQLSLDSFNIRYSDNSSRKYNYEELINLYQNAYGIDNEVAIELCSRIVADTTTKRESTALAEEHISELPESEIKLEQTLSGKFNIQLKGKAIQYVNQDEAINLIKDHYQIPQRQAQEIFVRVKNNFLLHTAKQRAQTLIGAKLIQLDDNNYLIMNPKWQPSTQVMGATALIKNLQQLTYGNEKYAEILRSKMLLKTPSQLKNEHINASEQQEKYIFTDAKGNTSKPLNDLEMVNLISKRYNIPKENALLLCNQKFAPQPNQYEIDALLIQKNNSTKLELPERKGRVLLPPRITNTQGEPIGFVTFKEAVQLLNIHYLERGIALSRKELTKKALYYQEYTNDLSEARKRGDYKPGDVLLPKKMRDKTPSPKHEGFENKSTTSKRIKKCLQIDKKESSDKTVDAVLLYYQNYTKHFLNARSKKSQKPKR